MIEERTQPIRYDMAQTVKVIDDLSEQLKSGNVKGSGKLRDGIKGDIENIMGWHGRQSPETPMRDDQRIEQLNRLQTAANSASNPESTRSVVGWMEERVEEISLRRADEMIANPNSIAESKKSGAAAIMDEITQLQQRLSGIKGQEYETVVGGQKTMATQYTSEQEETIKKLWQEIKQKKIELYNFVVSPE